MARERRRAEGPQRARLARGAGQGTEKAPSASAINSPPCSIRADSVLSERPSRSTTASMLTGPGCGARG
jgi:hypothetical protein